jgi:hypothetical protein
MTKAPTAIRTEITGTLEIDHYRGVIYFHAAGGGTKLRICDLPRPIPLGNQMLDITHMHSASWRATWPEANRG